MFQLHFVLLKTTPRLFSLNWLPCVDSNHDSKFQRLASCRLNDKAIKFMAHLAGLEPTTISLTGSRSAFELQMNKLTDGSVSTNTFRRTEYRLIFLPDLLGVDANNSTLFGGPPETRTLNPLLKREVCCL